MSQQGTDAGQALQATSASSLALNGTMNDAVNMAQLMAKAKVALPAHLHNNPGECLAIVMMAQTWGMNPYMVGQKTSVINGRLMYEGQLVNAVINRSGFLNGRLTYALEGEGEGLQVTVTGWLKGETEPRSLKIGMPKPGEARNSPLWKTQPEQQLIYKAVRMWARRFIPEVLLGVYTPEDDFHDLPPEMKEVREANAAAIENRLGHLRTSPVPALDAETVDEIARLNAGGNDVFTAGARQPAAAPEEGPGTIEGAAAAQNAEAAVGTLPATSPAEPNEAAMTRQDWIDAGYPVVEDVVLCPETGYAALDADKLKRIGSLLISSPAKFGIDPGPEDFDRIGGAGLRKALVAKGHGLIADQLRHAYEGTS